MNPICEPVRLLLVEDSPGDARLIRLSLEKQSVQYVLEVAPTLAAARVAVAGQEFAAILLDLSLPDSHGLRTVEQLVEITSTVPIIVITGLADEDLAMEAVRCGAQDYLVKGRTDAAGFTRAIRYAIERKQAEDALRQSEERFRLLFEQAPQGYQSLDADGHFLQVNQAWLETLGYAREEVIGRWFGDFLTPPFREAFLQRFPCFKKEGALRGVEFEMIRKDGGIIAVSFEGRIGYDAQGQFKQTHCILTDITERKKAQEQLRLQSVILDQIADCVTVTNTDGIITYVNDTTCRSIGKSRSDLVGQSVLVFGEDPTKGFTQQQILDGTLAEGHWQGELVNYASDGTELILNLQTRLVRDPDGHPMLVGVSTDITHRRHMEELLRESEERYRLLVESSPAGILTFQDGRCVFANPAGAAMLGYTPQEMVGLGLSRVVGRDYWPLIEKRQLDIKLGKSTPPVEVQAIRKDGSPILVETTGVPMVVGGKNATMSVLRDLTEQKRLEAQYRHAQKMEAVGRLAAGVAHDFNNQLTIIQGYCQILMKDLASSDPLWSPLTEIYKASTRAQSTTSHLLAFSRKQVLYPEVVDLGDMLTELRDPVSKIIGEDVHFTVVAQEGVPPVFVDRAGLHQAIMNLIVNARDAMPDGGELTLRIAGVTLDQAQAAEFPEASPGKYVMIEVADSGVGMDSQTLERVFEPFFTTKDAGKGTGLGVPMVQGFIRQSHGFIVFRSQKGTGTTARILLPPAQALEAMPVFQAPAASSSPRGSATILVVEDEDGVRGFIVGVLQALGHHVLQASRPSEALDLVAAHPGSVDLLITDIIMPEMRGDELVRQMQLLAGAPPTIYMTGYSDLAQDDDTNVLHKPFGIDELTAAVGAAISKVNSE